AGDEAQRLTSAAPVRIEIAAPASLPAERPPPPAPPSWRLRVAKARAGAGGRAGAFDPLLWRGVAFDPDKVELHAFRERVPALSADRPALARRVLA
ncbi:MAG TPA: hypothetical protein VED87_08725, partial [Methylocystis sp.]|nr:hypothetical protein [Methylocystis sp.]